MDKAREAAEWYARTFPGPLLSRTAGQQPARPAQRCAARNRPAPPGCRWSRPTIAIISIATTPRPTRSCSASRPARPWPMRRAGVSIPTSFTSRRPRRWRRRSAPTPKPFATRWRSRGGVDFEFEFGKFHFPIYQLDGECRDEMDSRTRGAGRGACARASTNAARRDSRRAAAKFDETPYYERLDREMPVIREMGFSGYMLIVADFINYARSHRDSGRPGPRLGRRQPGLLRARGSPRSIRSSTSCCSSAG